MDPREKSYQQHKFIFALMLAFVGVCALGSAFFNLIGVPMMEARLMDARTGWMAVATAVLCFAGSAFLFFRE
jgi:hypothetical protein